MMAKTIDFQAVKESLAALDRIAAEHPELLGESSQEEWEKTLSEMNTTTRKSGSERQRELREKRLAKGLCRPEVWAYPTDIEKLRAAYPGPRNGVDWQAVIKIALEQAGEQPQLDIKATERKAALLDRLSGFQVEMSGFKFDREEANAR